ncbi:MAG: TolC family protein [Opitutaceae bacterium]
MTVRTALALLLALAGPARAMPGTDLGAALAAAPGLAAARHRLDAAQIRAGARGRLADLELEAMGSSIRDPGVGGRREAYELTVRQSLPRPGERASDRVLGATATRLAEAELALAAADLAATVSGLLADATAARERAAVNLGLITRLESALAGLEARLTAGGNPGLVERLGLQSRRTALRLAVAEDERAAADAEAEARARLGLAPDAPLPAFAAPDPASILPAETAAAALARARAEDAEAAARFARVSTAPATAVGLRMERERMGSGFLHAVGLVLSTDLPTRRSAAARAEARAATAERQAAQSDEDASRRLARADLEHVARAAAFAEKARRLAAEITGRLEAEHEAVNRAFAAARPGQDSAVLHALDILDRTTGARLQVIAAETALRVRQAALWRHAPPAQLLAALTRGPTP